MFRRFERSLIYHPTRGLEFTGAQTGLPCEDVFFKTSGGVKLHGWFFRANSDSPRKHRVVLFCHGNGGNICNRLDVYRVLLDSGVNVFAFDYRGYGRSDARKLDEEGTYQDAMAAYQWLRGKGFASRDIIVYGESLGGGIASELALRAPVGGLILQSTFTSIPALGAELYKWLPVRWINTIRYDTLGKLPRIKVPILILHSREDRLVAFHHCEENLAAANEPKIFCELRGGHNDPLGDRDRFLQGIERFWEKIHHG
jgi:pimeloyl-ACP methyl ester carboxylesterase